MLNFKKAANNGCKGLEERDIEKKRERRKKESKDEKMRFILNRHFPKPLKTKAFPEFNKYIFLSRAGLFQVWLSRNAI